MNRVFVDSVVSPSRPRSDGNFDLHMELTSAPSSNSPSTAAVIPLLPFSSTVWINGCACKGLSLLYPTVYMLMQLSFSTDGDTWVMSTKSILGIMSVFVIGGPSCMSPTTSSGWSGTPTPFVSEFDRAARACSRRTALCHFPGFHLVPQGRRSCHTYAGIDRGWGTACTAGSGCQCS
jgi:hypothetical protein